jgi:hypothetical protein
VAKGNGKNGGGSSGSRIRFIMLDAELGDGDIGQITQAIQNALRPPVLAQPRALQSASAQKLVNPFAAEDPAAVVDDETDLIEPEANEAATTATQANARNKARKNRTPKVLDLDLTTAPSFSEFAATHNPPSDQMKYLTVAAWFKEHRGIEVVTADHVYTCFRVAKWDTAIDDFAAPLRALKHRQLVTQRGKGEFAINHLGLADVEKLRKA